MPYFFIINPRAGLDRKKEKLEKLISARFQAEKISFEIRYTEYPGHAAELAREAVIKGFNSVVAVGGDGTIREAASSLVAKPEHCLGIIPAGSGNGLARNLYLPLRAEEALEGILKWSPRAVDAALCNGRPFFCASGTGIDAVIAARFNSGRHHRGLLPYFYSALTVMLSYSPPEIYIELNGKKISSRPLIASFLNGEQYGGGARIAPKALIDDGFLDLVIIEKIGFFKILSSLPSLFNGRLDENSFFSSEKARTAKMILPPGSSYHLDGENFVTENGVLEFTVLPSALRVKAPELK